MNTCDKCKQQLPTDEFNWITADDFEPLEGENVPDSVYKTYDALCEQCYFEVIQ